MSSHVDYDLFPATLGKPATAFSRTLLKQFDLLSSISKTSAMDFVTTLQRLTNNAFPQDVPGFYKAFRRVMRVWRSIQIRKRAGEFHGMQELVGDTSAFFLALKCPACPQPGYNMPIKWKVEPSPDDKHRFTLFLSLDGNFKQQLKIKNCDKDDLELFIAFFDRKDVFDAYFASCTSHTEKSTCANLKAHNLQSQLKFLSMLVSGVISCKCSRHDFYLPGATVDLKKGESFAYTDFALRQALTGFEDYTNVVLSYDIACQYSKKVQTRFSNHFPECKTVIENMRFHVPKLHGHGHSDDCRYQFSFDYATNVGRTHGERIESGWAEGNMAGPSTREMNPGHRHETLSAFYNKWNYQQTVKLASYLAKKLVEARRQAAKKRTHFEKLTDSMGGDRVAIWNGMDTSPSVHDGEIISVYRVKNVKIPSMKTIEEHLGKEEANVQAASAHVKPAQFIADGLKLEARQRALKTKVLSDDASLQRVVLNINTERLKLRSEISLWRDDQALYMPDVLEYASESVTVEHEQLYLPSAIQQSRRAVPWFEQLADFETRLRKGQADDALSNLRLALRYKDSLDRNRARVAYGNRNSFRAAVLIRRVAELAESRADAYRIARKALISLGMSTKDASYPELKKEHVFLKRVFTEKELGEGTYTGSWIWDNGPRGVLSDREEDEWEEEGNKVEWFRARIDASQWREETEILDEELTRTAAWFSKMCELWTALGDRSTQRGSSEYAYQKADMFSRRAEETKRLHTWALAENVEPASPDAELTDSECSQGGDQMLSNPDATFNNAEPLSSSGVPPSSESFQDNSSRAASLISPPEQRVREVKSRNDAASDTGRQAVRAKDPSIGAPSGRSGELEKRRRDASPDAAPSKRARHDKGAQDAILDAPSSKRGRRSRDRPSRNASPPVSTSNRKQHCGDHTATSANSLRSRGSAQIDASILRQSEDPTVDIGVIGSKRVRRRTERALESGLPMFAED